MVGVVYAQKKKWYEWKLVAMHYDRFKDSTTLGVDRENANFVRKWEQEFYKRPCLFPFVTFDGKVPSDPSPLLNMAFLSKSRDRKFISGYNLRLRALVDGKPMAMPETNRTGDVGRSGTVIEIIFFDLPWEDFYKLCDAQVIEFQLGLEEFKVGEPEFAAWRQFRQAYLDLLEDK
ncbi:hypothetical protein KA005_57960 [bacterium]|nr:hypothetical protein [bacterium]